MPNDLPKCVQARKPDKTKGVVRGTRPCQMEGCRGIRLIVQWPDGRRTHPCTRGMEAVSATTWRIL